MSKLFDPKRDDVLHDLRMRELKFQADHAILLQDKAADKKLQSYKEELELLEQQKVKDHTRTRDVLILEKEEEHKHKTMFAEQAARIAEDMKQADHIRQLEILKVQLAAKGTT